MAQRGPFALDDEISYEVFLVVYCYVMPTILIYLPYPDTVIVLLLSTGVVRSVGHFPLF